MSAVIEEFRPRRSLDPFLRSEHSTESPEVRVSEPVTKLRASEPFHATAFSSAVPSVNEVSARPDANDSGSAAESAESTELRATEPFRPTAFSGAVPSVNEVSARPSANDSGSAAESTESRVPDFWATEVRATTYPCCVRHRHQLQGAVAAVLFFVLILFSEAEGCAAEVIRAAVVGTHEEVLRGALRPRRTPSRCPGVGDGGVGWGRFVLILVSEAEGCAAEVIRAAVVGTHEEVNRGAFSVHAPEGPPPSTPASVTVA